LLKEYGQDGGGLFATSTMLEKHTLLHYRVKVIGRVESVRMRYYAISTERRIRNAAVTMIVDQARREVFE
jgi:LysR family transcriptional activator of nhaA